MIIIAVISDLRIIYFRISDNFNGIFKKYNVEKEIICFARLSFRKHVSNINDFSDYEKSLFLFLSKYYANSTTDIFSDINTQKLNYFNSHEMQNIMFKSWIMLK